MMSLRTFAHRWFPFLLPVARGARTLVHRVLGRRRIFRLIHKHNLWGNAASVSGSGSTLESTEAIRQAIPGLLQSLAVRSLLDAPCGDFFWMRRMELPEVMYVGIDIVPTLIQENQSLYGGPSRRFEVRDLVLCRDCLVHLPFAEALAALRNFRRSGAQFLLTTTFDERSKNHDIAPGEWRPLNLRLPPFNFPAPLSAIDERSTENGGIYSDKRLALWKFDDLPLPDGQ
jgi:hypothetical protein